MRAWRVHEKGDPLDVMRLEAADPAERPPGEVLIAVRAAGLNFPDLLLCRGEYQERPGYPFTPGLEVAGVVEEADSDGAIQVGDRVVALTVLPHGGLAEKITARATETFPIPDSLGFEAAAAFTLTYQTAYFALHRRAALQAGEVLLVHGGAGGAGSAAIELGRGAGARVIATATGAEKARRCRDLGAEVSIDLQREDFVEAVKTITAGRGADVVFDPVGGEVFNRSRRCIAFEGRLLAIGFASGEIPQLPVNHALIKNYSLVGVHWGLHRQREPSAIASTHRTLMELYEQGDIAPLIGLRVPFEQAADALAQLAERRTYGKAVVSMTESEVRA